MGKSWMGIGKGMMNALIFIWLAAKQAREKLAQNQHWNEQWKNNQ